MSKINVENLVYDDITLIISDITEGIKLSFQGSIDMEYPQQKLDGYFMKIHEELISNKIKNINCDFNQLSYINSSGIRCLVKWIVNLINIKDSEQKYIMDFYINKEYEWQVASLGFLSGLCPELIHIKK
ncbi:MAG: hypothetical protein JXJ04_02460 [Spirochaetales bacterium]|nr:hypothetical protein [Spirochaetales bacterium]